MTSPDIDAAARGSRAASDPIMRLADRAVVLSGKPTRVLEIITLQTPRPRAVGDHNLHPRRQKLVRLFGSLEQPAAQREIVG